MTLSFSRVFSTQGSIETREQLSARMHAGMYLHIHMHIYIYIYIYIYEPDTFRVYLTTVLYLQY